MGKMKASRVKKSNKQRTKLGRQGKLKMKRHKRKTLTRLTTQKPPANVDPTLEEEEEEESDHGQGLLEMVDQDDLEFLKKAVAEGKYSMFQGKNFKQERKFLKRKAEENDEKGIEESYESKSLGDDRMNKKQKHLLPIKTKDGVVRRIVMDEESEGEEEVPIPKSVKVEPTEGDDEDEDSDIELDKKPKDLSKPISVAEMLAWREKSIAQYKFKIGILCSGLLEDPQIKVLNIAKVLDIFDTWQPELQVTLKKLVMVSLLEVFKDILPSYSIKHQDEPGVKLKKDTKELQTFEKSLLKGYRGYLTRLEKLASRLYRKKGDTRVRTKGDMTLGELAINCLCELLMTHPYFNYSTNLVRLLTPYLDNKEAHVRTTVANCFKHLFLHDKRGEITVEVVRRINDLVKNRKHAVKCEVISILTSLRISEINLEQIKEAELKHKKALAKKSRLLNLSKKERKRRKRLEEVEQELMETKAEENKQKRGALLTEVTKLVFTIYFRILKNAPSSGLLSTALQGLAKFAHCINIEFYLDIVGVLDHLMANGELKVQEQLNCILTVFTILSGQGEVLNVDPNRFYAHLYKNMLEIDLGKNASNMEILIDCVDKVVLGRRKKLTQQRLFAFTKRLTSLALQHEHHSALGCLAVVKQALQMNKSLDVLLEVDSSVGQGVYLPELSDPEYCNAASTALYELALLQRHYHPIVRKVADNLANGVPISGKFAMPPDIGKLSPMEIFKDFDPSEMAFKPSVPPPSKKVKSSIKGEHRLPEELRKMSEEILRSDEKIDFSGFFNSFIKCRIKQEEDD